MRLIALFILTLTPNLFFGQVAIIKEVSRTNKVSKEKYVFPKIIMSQFPDRARKINNYLREDILAVEPDTPDSTIFNEVWKVEGEPLPTLSNLEYEVIRNKNSILSVKISAEGCGAYCEDWERFFTFNLKTGNIIRLDSIFSMEGLENLSNYMDSIKQSKIKNKLREINDTLNSPSVKNTPNDLEYYNEMLELYTDCLDSKITYEYISEYEYSITSYGLIIYSDRCSAHYNRNADELWTFEYPIDLNQWVDLLTPLGKKLIQDLGAKMRKIK